MSTARTLRNDREKMGEHPMYRASRGPGHLQSQSQPGADQYRVRRGEDPLAELARLIGQEDPFAEFNFKQRRAPSNGHAPVKAVTPERRTNGNSAYTNGHANGYSNGHGVQARGNGHDVSRQPASVRSQPVRAPEERQPAAARSRALPPVAQPRTNGAVHAYQDEARTPQPRPNGRDPQARLAERGYRPSVEDFADEEPRQTRQPAREHRAPRGDRYVPEEAPRYARARPQPQQQPPAYRDDYQRRYENDYDPQYDDEAYLNEQADDVYGEVPRSRRGIGFWIVAAIVLASLVAVAFLGVFAYRTIFNAPPRAAVITRSDAPTKVEPQKAALQTNSAAPNKTIQDRIAGADQTQTLKREEQPVDLTTQNRPQFAPVQQQQPQPAPQKAAPAFTPPPQQQAPQAMEQGPKKVKTMTIRSDGTVVNQQQAPQNNAPLPLNANPPAAEEDAPPVQQRPQSNVQPNRNVASLGPTPPPVQQQQQTSGNYVVQVASHKTPEEAQQAWSALKTQHASIFGTRNADIRKVDLGDRGTFYRAMVGPMSRDQANALCQNLKTAGAGCIVQTR